MAWNLDHSYARLPPEFHAAEQPATPAAPRLLLFNAALAADLGLPVDTDAMAAWLSGKALPPGARPLAQAYAGHQYGNFTMLGDGRAILLGEQITPDGRRVDVQLKGAGQTVFSRNGDGRAALAPMLREYLVSETMHALGVPTTRSLAVVATGEPVWRDAPKPGAVLARIARSHLRVGTLEYAAAYAQQAPSPTSLRALADYVIARHDPDLREAGNPYLALLEAIVARQIELVADWQAIGFVHGVLNTDNVALSGETLDYGPCAFMDAYDPATVFSSIDRHGRYAYGNQPRITGWNLARCAAALLPLLANDEAEALAQAEAVLGRFDARFEAAWLARFAGKLGLSEVQSDDAVLVQDLLDAMQLHRADFTNTFRRLSVGDGDERDYPGTETVFAAPAFPAWQARWQERLARSARSIEHARAAMRGVNPAVIPRNHRVEAALAAAEAGDLGPVQAFLQVLAAPFVDTPTNRTWREPGPGGPYRTFCGT